MMNMKLLSVVTPPSIYHGCSTQKTFWEEKFTLGEFTAVNMKNCGCRNVRKHRYIKGSDKYVTLDISLKFDSMYKTRIKSSGSKDNLGRSGKGLITSLGLKAKARPKKYKKSRYAIVNVRKKDLSKIIREFEKLPYESDDKKSPKHEPTDNLFYLLIKLTKCMMRSDALNSHIYRVRTEMTAMKQITTSHVCSTDDTELKEFLVEFFLSYICSTDKDESIGIIVDKCSTEEDES